MNGIAIKVFENEKFGKVRTIVIDNEPWFVGKEVATILGYTNPHKAVRDHVDAEDRGVNEMDTPSGTQSIAIINESGIYSLILRSKLPQAREFKRWVTSEVLPSIRKNGGYIATNENMSDEEIMARALVVAQDTIKRRDERIARLKRIEQKQYTEIKEQKEQIISLSQEIESMQPKISYYDTILNNKSTVLVTQIAQDYGMSAKAFNNVLNDLHIQHKVGNQWILYAPYLSQGYVQSKSVEIKKHDGSTIVKYNTEWTQKGRLFLYEELKKKDIIPLIER